MSIFNIDRIAYSWNDQISNNKKDNKGALTKILMYFFIDKQSKEISLKRADFGGSIDPNLPDLDDYIRVRGQKVDIDKARNTVRDFSKKTIQFINNKYTNNSNKFGCLNEEGECYETAGDNGLFLNHIYTSYAPEEAYKLKKKYNNDESKIKDYMLQKAKEEYVDYINRSKNIMKIKGPKTKPSDIEMLFNFHMHDNYIHIHCISHSFDPVSKLFINPPSPNKVVQEIAIEFEKKNADILLQGVAAGYDKSEGLKSRMSLIEEIKLDGTTDEQAIDKLEELKDKIEALVLDNSYNCSETVSELKKQGVELYYTAGDKVKIKAFGKDIELTQDSFGDDKFSRKLTTFAKAGNLEERLPFKVNELETVLAKNLAMVKTELDKELKKLPANNHSEAKKRAFLQFTEICRKSGVMVDMNKQKHLSYHKISLNKRANENNVSSHKYNSSKLQDSTLKGKHLYSYFDLDEQAILDHQTNLLRRMPKTIKYRDRVFLNLDLSDVNLLEDESYFLKSIDKLLKDITGIPNDKGLTYYNKKGEALIDFKDLGNGQSEITISNLRPKQSAILLKAMLLEEVRSMKEGEVMTITPSTDKQSFDDLRHLHIQLLFSPDKNSHKIAVDYPDMKSDPELNKLIEIELKSKIKRFSSTFKTYGKEPKKKFNFTKAYGIELLDNPKLKGLDSLVADNLNKQIVELVAKKDVKEILFNNKVPAVFLDKNKDKIIDICDEMNLTAEQKKKVINYLEKNTTKQEKEFNNKVKSKFGI